MIVDSVSSLIRKKNLEMRRIGGVMLVLGLAVLLLQGKGFATGMELGIMSEEERQMAEAIAFEVIYSRTLERDLKAPAGESDKIGSMDQTHLKIAYTQFKELQPYIKIGTTRLTEEMGSVNITGLGIRDIDFDYDLGLSLGLGVNGVSKINDNGYLFGYDVQYLRSKHDLGEVTHNGQKATSVAGDAVLQEVHAGAWLGKEFDLGEVAGLSSKLTPYFGGRFSSLRLKIDKDVQYTVTEGTIGVTGNSKAEDNFGLFTGVKLDLGSNWNLRLEGRFIDETALSVAAGYKF